MIGFADLFIQASHHYAALLLNFPYGPCSFFLIFFNFAFWQVPFVVTVNEQIFALRVYYHTACSFYKCIAFDHFFQVCFSVIAMDVVKFITRFPVKLIIKCFQIKCLCVNPLVFFYMLWNRLGDEDNFFVNINSVLLSHV